MDRDDIIRMAREVGLTDWETSSYGNQLEWFASLVAAAEREACAELCEHLPADEFVDRSEATIWDLATLDCAAAIRARSQNGL